MFGLFKRKPKIPNFVNISCVKDCGKEKCPQWVVMYHTIINKDGKEEQKAEGRCAHAWVPFLLVELTQAIRSLKEPDNGDKKT